ncbi:unnamed protein product [Pleuronectes platessa]|uniref:TIR domain-containing protein n=1 Tax=Pleuronectes platessa TaxID=8262 RepID=A0A9N7V0S4_PLEPL|nr:unnamed protein product [Pleuronectes platessa]
MLNLSSNLLGEIYSDTFANLEDLRVLDLSYNHIGALGYRAFSDLPKLRALYLTGNSLRRLGSPASLPNLEFLLLGDNKLKSLFNIADLGMNSTYVDVSENRLTSLEEVYSTVTNFKRLKTFFYSSNFIKGISSNLLTALPQGIFRGLSSMKELDLSTNSLTFLQPDVFPVSLKRVDLSNNFLAYPDPMTFQSLLFLNLADNRFYCDCNLESFLQWLNVTNVTVLSPAEGYRCEFPAALHNLPLLDYATIVEPCEKDDEKAVQDLKFTLFIFSALLIITVTLSGVVYARLRGQIFVIYKKILGRVLEGPKVAPCFEDMQYDVFFCFSNSDYKWVEAALLNKLDDQFSEENVLHCCFEARDFLPGEDHLTNIRDAIWGSRKTVCVISKEFLKDGWCLEAFTLAQSRMVEELKNVLILLVIGKVAHYKLMRYNAIREFIQKREYLTWPEDPQDLDWFYERLISQILRNTKMKMFAEDKPQAAQPQPQNEDRVELEDIRAVAM